MKLALGTAQFGMDYGISNKKGKVPLCEVKEIMSLATEKCIDLIDTAQCYGDSEQTLGQLNLSDFKVVTKIAENCRIEDSLKALNITKLYGVLIHREEEISLAFWALLKTWKSQGLVQKIGVSVYHPEKLEQIINQYDIDIVQLPLNLLDQRFLPILPKLKGNNIEVHARSVFLQGLLLMNNQDIDEYFNPIIPILSKIPGDDKIGFVLSFVKSIPEVDKIVVGCTSKQEFSEVLFSYNKDYSTEYYSDFFVNDERFVNPSMWNLKNEPR